MPADNEDEPTITGDLEVIRSLRGGKKPFLLEQVQGPGAPREFELLLPEMVVGRSTQAHVSIDSHRISRKHMALRRVGDEFSATDLDSSNGVFLNGVRAHSATLHDGDQLQIGDVLFVYREGGR